MNLILLQTEQNTGFMFIMIALIFIFFIIVPQFMRQRKEKKFVGELAKGNQVVTTSGIHGKLIELHENTVIVETGAGKLTMEKSAIAMELTKNRYGKKK